jgi:histidine triad (HIT) family protein
MATIFSKIITGEIPCYKLAENEEFIAFLDINPLALGHTLVIPKSEIDYLFDLEDDLLGRIMTFSKDVARKLKKSIDCDRIGVCVIGLEVPHAHIHLIPIKSVSDMNFSKAKLKLSEKELMDIQSRILMS